MQSSTSRVETPQTVDRIIDGFVDEACGYLMQVSKMPSVQVQNDCRAAAVRCFDGHRFPFDRAHSAVLHAARQSIEDDPVAVRAWDFVVK